MWTVVYIAPDRAAAERMRDALAREGLLAILRPAGPPREELEAGAVEILVPESEVEEAHEVLSNSQGR